jgi:5-amino-6-(5-phosphoribosylamino)uracil reductase
VLLSCAVSLDGYIDDASGTRLRLSGEADFDRVDAVRAGCDAIMTGAATIRADDPRLLVRSEARRAARAARGLPPDLVKVTVTATGDLDPGARFFTTGTEPKLVYCPDPAVDAVRARLGPSATVIGAGDPLGLGRVLDDLGGRGIGRLMVEGGGRVHTQLLAAGLADELQVAVAPFLIGDPAAPRLFGPAAYPTDPAHPMPLAEARPIGDLVLLRYELRPDPERDRRFLLEAVALARNCPPSATAFSVGALIVGGGGEVLATGWSREADPHDHAEEAALAKLAGDPLLAGATVYSSLEPCSTRASRPRSCTELLLAAGVRRVVLAWREPSVFVDCTGAEDLRAAGVEVVELPELAEGVRQANAHLLDGS